ncbi:zinc ABC transporter substrate-binding protein [uncultured Brachyspira sp.]|uniref:metal ABC transporter substrate-binding protein n=1 Tax=uncultured Brachyspira sp. TaxID=221953 RepID=UPI0025D7AE32|nr:zinc ABC transporter substrate-binding protein [uncultured Brachyspira sp.]
MKKIILSVFALSFLIGCSNSSKTNLVNKPQIYTSIYPIYDFTKKIGGDKIDVYNMTSSGAEPHNFEITSKDMADLTKANLFIYNGGGMEHWVDTVKNSIKELNYLESSFNIDDKDLDPHFWLSPIKAKKQMENIKNALSDIDSDNAEYYNSNYNFYAEKLDELDSKFREYLSNASNTNLVVTHAAFGHFCKEYLLNQFSVARDEADPKAISDTIVFIKKNNVEAIFYEDFSSRKLANSIAKETGIKILTLNPIESLSEEYINAGEDYFSVMEKNFISLTNGLN